MGAVISDSPLPPCDPPQLQAERYAHHRVEVPVMRWQDRALLRVSMPACNSPANIACLLAALADTLQRQNAASTS